MSADSKQKRRSPFSLSDSRALQYRITGLLEQLLDGRALADVLPELPERFAVDYDDVKHRYWIDGDIVDSVTQVLDKTRNKPALTWWGYRVGMASVLRLLTASEGGVSIGQLMAWDWEAVIKPDRDPDHPDLVLRGGKSKHALEAAALDLGSSPNHIKDEKGTLGTSVHKAGEKLGLTGEVPTIEEFPEADRGYVQALARWHVDQEVEHELLEVIVASHYLRYAGRFDLVGRKPNGKRAMFDYKTSGGIYPEFDCQISLYDIAWLENGHEPLDEHYLVHLRPDGTYEQVPVVVDHVAALTELLAFHVRACHDHQIKQLGREV